METPFNLQLPLHALAHGRLEQAARPVSASAGSSPMPHDIAEAAESFEAVFLGQMLQPLFQDLETDGLFGGGQAEGMYRSILVDEVGKSIAQSGGIGIAEMVAAELIKLQES